MESRFIKGEGGGGGGEAFIHAKTKMKSKTKAGTPKKPFLKKLHTIETTPR